MSSPIETLTRVADRYIPAMLREDAGTRLRARLILLYAAVTLLTCPVFVCLYWFDGQRALAVVVAVATVLGLLVPLVLAKSRSLFITGNYTTSVFTGAQAALLVLSGGFDLGTIYWLGAATVFGTFLAGRRSGLFWLVASSVAIGLSTALFERGGILPTIGHAPPPPMDAFAAVVLAGVLFTFAMIYERTKDNTLRSVEEARARAEEASRARGEFIATLSHEVRTPLNGILGMANAMLLDDLAATERERLEIIKRSGEGLVRVVDDVLELSRLAAGLTVARHEVRFDAAALVQEVARLFGPAAAVKGLSVVVAPAAPLFVRADAGKIRQILSNIVANAVQYTERGGVSLSVSLTPEPGAAARGELRVVVVDTGPGIAAADLSRIYEPYARFAKGPSGSGIGLTISRSLAAAVGGQLAATTELGKGTTFTLLVPVAIAADADDVTVAPTSVPHAPLVGRVLVVEDNAVNREVARLLLRNTGLAVDFAEEGHAAVQAMDHASYDLVLMDCEMPGLDGYEATRQIRRLEGTLRHTPIVAMTAAVLDSDKQRCIDAGMDAHLPKPVTLEGLAQVLHRYLAAGVGP